MIQKLDKHVFMTIAEVCADLHPWSNYSTLALNLQHFQVLVRNNDFTSKTLKTYISVVMNVLERVYGFNDELSTDYFLRFLSNDDCLKFGNAAVLMKRYDTQVSGNDRYIKFDREGKIFLNI